MKLLTVDGLSKHFSRSGLWRASGGKVRAVNDVSFELDAGETLAIVGESGSGKSTTANLVMRLLDANSGRIRLMGEDITHMHGKALRGMRRHMQMVFQDPYASLNPRMRIAETVGEGLRVHARDMSPGQRLDRVAEVLAQCGMSAEAMKRYPHQFSGGQRQRIGIARALAVSPRLLVLDEPVSALDVSVQAQILNLLRELQREMGLAYLFISHDLSVVRQVARRVAVMFAGHLVEEGAIHDVFDRPRHPYTRGLLDARPIEHPGQRRKTSSQPRDMEDVADEGCPYYFRCPHAQGDCRQFDPVLSADDHSVACLHPVTTGQ
ncbi:MAG: ABC transporter ATP-binding protein [Mariprofundaceae bacterium]